MSWEASAFPKHSQGQRLPLPHQGLRVYTSPCSLPGQSKVPFLHVGPSIPVTDQWILQVSASPQDQPHAGSRDGGCSLCFARCICCCSLQKPLHNVKRKPDARCHPPSPLACWVLCHTNRNVINALCSLMLSTPQALLPHKPILPHTSALICVKEEIRNTN